MISKKKKNPKEVLRMMDANFNRSREGLRVCEDVCRFVAKKPASAKALKTIRHALSDMIRDGMPKGLLAARDSERDPGRGAQKIEEKREAWQDLFWANLQRAKESLRVLEEALKLYSVPKARQIKVMRFKIYGIEKRSLKEIPPIRHR